MNKKNNFNLDDMELVVKKLQKQSQDLAQSLINFELKIDVFKALKEQLDNQDKNDIECVKCGCTEFLCGHNKRD